MDRGAAYSDCVVNALPEAKRMSVLDLWDQGKGLREIERLTGVHRDTVMRLVLGPRANRKLKKLVFAIGDWLEARGLDPGMCDPLAELHCELYRCPRHPNASPLEDIDDTGCRFCKSDAAKIHNAKRKKPAASAEIPPPPVTQRSPTALKRIETTKRNAQGLAEGEQRLRLCGADKCDRPGDLKLGRFLVPSKCSRCGDDVTSGWVVVERA